MMAYVECDEIEFLNLSTRYRARFWDLGAAISIFFKGRTRKCPNARIASTPLSTRIYWFKTAPSLT